MYKKSESHSKQTSTEYKKTQTKSMPTVIKALYQVSSYMWIRLGVTIHAD